MDLANNEILITGGATGIGFGLAERFVRAGSKVIVCGRRIEKLSEAKRRLSGLETHMCDLSDPQERLDLAKWVLKAHPKLNILINNAGIQRYPDLTRHEPWAETCQETAINLEAPIHLCTLFAHHLSKATNPAIVNVTSGLSFAPLVKAPVYSATKAALHSFTLSLRHQLKNLGIQVIEIIPPAVNTDLGGQGLHTFGANLDEFADHVFQELAEGKIEIAYGTADAVRNASPDQLNAIFEKMNSR